MKLVCRWMLCRSAHLSLRELFMIILFVAAISVIVTYHISKYILQRQQTEFKIHFNGRVDIYRNFRMKDRQADVARESDERRSLEGIDLEDGFKHRRKAESTLSRRQRTGSKRNPTALYKKLVELEDAEVGTTDPHPQVALVCGDRVSMAQTLPLYAHALSRVGYALATASGPIKDVNETTSGEVSCDSSITQRQTWSVLLCVSDGATDGVCVQKVSPPSDHLQHRINQITPIVEHLGSKAALCKTLSSAQHVPALRRSQLVPPCFHLPAQWNTFLLLADALGPQAKWVLKPNHGHQGAAGEYAYNQGAPVMLLQPTKKRDFHKLREGSQRDTVVQLYQERPLLLYGMPFSITAFVLVTSLSPLRVYLHSEGVIHYRHDYQRHFKKVSGRTWSLERLRQYVSETYGKEAATIALTNLQSVIVQTLLVTQTLSVSDSSAYSQRCEQCFQLLGFEVIFNSSFHPVLLEVNAHPDLSDLAVPGEGAGPAHSGWSSVVDDMLSLVLGSASVAGTVSKALEEITHHVGVQGIDCQHFHKVCLTAADLRNMLAVRREAIHRAAFTQLYPSFDSDKYSTLVEELYKFSPQPKENLMAGTRRSHKREPLSSSESHRQEALHSIFVSMARYYHTLDAVEDSYDDLNVPLFQESRNFRQGVPKLVENIFQNSTNLEKKYVRQRCSEDKSVMPLLAGIHTEPKLNITPAFSADVLEYYATVPYDLFLVKVWGITQSCFCEARLEDKYGLSRPSNYTLGLGANRVSILVVDVTHTEPWTLTVYTLHIYRQARAEGRSQFTPTLPHVVCHLQQDCDLPLYLNSPCGLQVAPYPTWGSYLAHTRHLPKCTTGAAPGKWMLPCLDCSLSDSCYWSAAQWQPHTCNHVRLKRDSLKKCLSGKQILFIGDSTNRGMMHYLMEAANDSLTEWDKTHNIKVYTNINHEHTTVSFAYYPQFWLPAAQRPVFDKALYQLMKKSVPMQNNGQTVLVVGGVHWLATHHLNVIRKALQREGMSRIQVVIKGLGAGFHQPVDGLHCLTQREHRKLVLHNAGLMDYARQLGFHVVDTFNMTMARYKDFLQGKCACHFHRVREVLPSFTQFLQSTGRHGNRTLVDMPIYYHVDGDINAEYSEILINRICGIR